MDSGAAEPDLQFQFQFSYSSSFKLKFSFLIKLVILRWRKTKINEKKMLNHFWFKLFNLWKSPDNVIINFNFAAAVENRQINWKSVLSP